MHESLLEALEILQDTSNTPELLYQKWWSGHRNSNRYRASTPDFFNEKIVRVLSHSEGAIICFDGNSTIRIEDGQYLDFGWRRAVARRLKVWDEPHWRWRQSDSFEPYPRQERMVRIYIPSTREDSDLVASGIQEHLIKNEFWFKMKTRLDEGVFHDKTVIWVQADLLASIFEKVSERVESPVVKPPPATFQSCGIGIADHPKNGESLGWLLCSTLWKYARSQTEENLEASLSAVGLSSSEPWRLNENLTIDWTANFDKH